MLRTGKFVSESEYERLNQLFERTREPILGGTIRQLFNTAQRIDDAVVAFYSELDKVSVAAGLPEPEEDADGYSIHYGLDFSTREIVSV